jgi:hypothetical protein
MPDVVWWDGRAVVTSREMMGMVEAIWKGEGREVGFGCLRLTPALATHHTIFFFTVPLQAKLR